MLLPRDSRSSTSPPDEAKFANPDGALDEAPNEHWPRLVSQIQAGNPDAMEELYQILSGGIRIYIQRQLGADEIEDHVHDTFLVLVAAIRQGEIREPERLMGFVRTVVRRQIANWIGRLQQTRRDQEVVDQQTMQIHDQRRTPEETAMESEKHEIITRALESLTDRQREILIRFYLMEQTQERICREMRLTDTQFRLMKSRAKALFGRTGRKTLIRESLERLSLREKSAPAHC
ncbi:MAG: sigma-70 family RNA polymerase sigma factor [Bryobacteraceae bacterium]|nr:sigma-70 family RNA polymerase sigma factor [Bryobacteraceae bacterium]